MQKEKWVFFCFKFNKNFIYFFFLQRNKQETSKRNNEYADDDEDEDMTPAERLAEKLRLQKLQEEADLLTALDTLGLTAEKTTTPSTGIDGMSPTNKAEFSELSEAISKKVSTFKSSEEFSGFLEELVQSVCANCKFKKKLIIFVLNINV